MVQDSWVLPWVEKGAFPQLLQLEFTKGFLSPDLLNIDKVVSRYMAEYQIPGMSIAITRKGRLVYAKGFGLAKKESGLEIVGVFHRFRIASVSKPITAVAIMTLIEQQNLALTTRVFGSGSIFGTDYGFSTLSPQNQSFLSQITVQHLLEHRVGAWPNTNDPIDPMMIQTQLNQEQLITWTLQNRPLTKPPGTDHVYSNFGYCLLGRVIERVSKRTYAEFVQESILSRCGITTMAIAGDSLAERQSDEVVYYGGQQIVKVQIGGITHKYQIYDDPYLVPVSRMDAHGGWIASAVDLVRFAVHVDGVSQPPDILNATSLQTMITPTAGKYAKGWQIFQDPDEHNWYHKGRLPGLTSLLLGHKPLPTGLGMIGDDLCFAVLANTRHPNDEQQDPMEDNLDRLMWRFFVDIDPNKFPLVGGPKFVSQWPDHDLFPVYDDPWGLVTVSSA
jgi:D-alanyl-D-alanine carboxypeptidase